MVKFVQKYQCCILNQVGLVILDVFITHTEVSVVVTYETVTFLGQAFKFL